MTKRTSSALGVLAVVTVACVLGGGAAAAQGAPILYDGFESGGANPGAGQYATGTGYSGSPSDRLNG